MRVRTIAFALLLATTAPLAADPPRWKFKPGQTFTYECRSTFHFATFQAGAFSASGDRPTGDDPPDSDEEWVRWMDKIYRSAVERTLQTETDPARRKALQALLSKPGPITLRDALAVGLDPQWETVTLTAEVAAVGDDGSARLKVTVDAVRIETRFDDTGARALWDSQEKAPARFAGFKPYAAMVGHAFEVIVAANGAIREMKGADWPAPEIAGPVGKKDEREASAANATHLPTPARVWMHLLFTVMPTGADAWERTAGLPEDEVLSLRADSPEQAGGHACVRAKFRSRDRERAVDGRRMAWQMKDGDLAMRMCREAQKQGHSWFAPAAGCLVKAEVKSSSEMSGDRLIVGDFVMEIELKNRGLRDLAPRADEAEDEPTR
jgi:hypothetical protein